MLQTLPISEVLAEEISLEGLEGSTLDTLSVRLSVRLKIKPPLPELFCNQVWKILLRNQEYKYYVLPNARAQFVPFDRVEHVDPMSGTHKEQPNPGHKFKYNPICQGVMGSCEDFATRSKIPKEEVALLKWKEVEEKYGNSFVVVASQKLREYFLLPSTCNIDLTILQYCIIERVGRSRFNGETSHGKYSLLDITKDSSILFYHRKILTKNKMITKQTFCQRGTEISTLGMIFHLPRYYTEMKPKIMILTEKVVELLKTKPNYMADYDEIRSIYIGKNESSKKLFRTSEFQRHIKIDTYVPYRLIYPDAEPQDFLSKNSKEEKMLRVMQLINPVSDVNDLWYRDEQVDENENAGFLDNTNEFLDVSILQTAFMLIADNGSDGLTQSELATKMGLSRLNARAVVKNLTKLKAVSMYMFDEGRQRVTRYTAAQQDEAHECSYSAEAYQLMNSQTSMSTTVTTENTTATIKCEPSSMLKTAPENLYSCSKIYLDDIDCDLVIADRIFGMKKPSKGIGNFMSSKKISAKYLWRCNMIIDIVKKFKVVDSAFILKKITKEENGRGYKDKVCKKSINRLIAQLAVDKFIKVATILLKKKEEKIRKFIYVCDLPITKEDPVLRSKIEFARSKAFLVTFKPQSQDKTGRKDTVDESLPKFLRMKLFHEFLFHLLHVIPIDSLPIPKEVAIQSWMVQYPALDLTNIAEEMSPVFSDVQDWRMFVPPLYSFSQHAVGWTLLTDVILRIPLSLFCQLCTFQRDIPELNDYLLHPIRKHFLVKNLPENIRAKLYYRRKYIFNVDEIARRLCYAGLLQFGPQRMKEKDQIYIYLNRYTALLNTSSSEPGYHKVEEKEYPMTTYSFFNMDDLTTYWADLYTFTATTKLNRRAVLQGQEIVIEQLPTKQAMIEATKSQTVQSAQENDKPVSPPGDGLGAGGLDSAFFSHLRLNWHKCTAINQRKAPISIRTKKLEVIRKTYMRSIKNSDRKKQAFDKKLLKKDRHLIKPVHISKKVKMGTKNQSVVRKMPMKNQKIRKKPIYDDEDRKALKLMSKLRVNWTTSEDNLLLICKIALMYLYKDPKSCTIINYQIVRDIMHWTSRKSANKTSRACQRRVNYMLKNESIATSVKLSLVEAQQNEIINEKFGPNFCTQLKRMHIKDMEKMAKVLKIHYINLVYNLTKVLSRLKIDKCFAEEPQILLPDKLSEFKDKYLEISTNYNSYPLKYETNPRDVNTIHIYALTLLIHSAVCTMKDKSSLSMQLFNIYKHYPEKILSNAMKKVRLDKLISMNKCAKSKPISTKFVPTSNHPFHLSITYQNQITTSFPFEILEDFHDVFLNVITCNDFSNSDSGRIGFLFVLAELALKDAVDIKIEPPEKGLRFDPSIKNVHQVYAEKMDRFQDIYQIVRPEEEKQKVNADASTSKIVIKKEKTNKHKVNFDSDNIVSYIYPQHPIEKLMKLPSSNYHFFCILKNMHTKILTQSYKIHTDSNICTLHDCIMLGMNVDIIRTCAQITVACKCTIKRIIEAQQTHNRIDYLNQNFIFREDNAIQIFSKLMLTLENESILLKDVGKHNDNMRSIPDILEILNDILYFNDVKENTEWLKEYRIEQPEKDQYKEINVAPTALSTKSMAKDEISEKIHKLHDFFIVNSSKLSVKIKTGNIDTKDTVLFENVEVPKELIIVSNEKKSKILERISSDAIWPDQKQLLPLLEMAKPAIKQNKRMSVILNYIEAAKQIGVTAMELMEKFQNKKELTNIVGALVKCKLVVRTGFRHITFVFWKYVDEWIIKTFHIKRLAKEAIKPIDAKDVANACLENYPDSIKRKHVDEDEVAAGPSTKRAKTDERQVYESKATSIIATTPSQNLNVLIAPWIKVDGKLNRRMLDRWLTAIALYCISHPGVKLNKLYSRFNLLPPFHINYLLHVLVDFECLTMKVIELQKPSLFSTFKSSTICNATDFDRDEHIFIELSDDILTKMTILIGEKKYKNEFI